MSKYWTNNIPSEIHFIYGGRDSGKTYREFEKLKTRIKELKEENKFLKGQRDNILNNVGKAANYILDNCISEETGRISDPDILKIYKFLTGGAVPIIKRGVENANI